MTHARSRRLRSGLGRAGNFSPLGTLLRDPLRLPPRLRPIRALRLRHRDVEVPTATTQEPSLAEAQTGRRRSQADPLASLVLSHAVPSAPTGRWHYSLPASAAMIIAAGTSRNCARSVPSSRLPSIQTTARRKTPSDVRP